MLVICLLQQHKDNNDRLGAQESRQIFAHLTMHVHEPEVRTNFRSVHRRPSYSSSSRKGRNSDAPR